MYGSQRRTWVVKFSDAFRGVAQGVRGQSSFYVHIAMAILVVLVAAFLRVSAAEWCLLVLCIAGVWTAELFNSSIEFLAKATDTQHNANLGAALDIASGAVLVMSIGSVVVGLIVLGPKLWVRFLI